MDAMLLYEEGKALLMQGKRSEAFDKFIHTAQMGSEEAATALRIVFGYRDVTCTDSPSAEVAPAEEQVPPLMPKGDSLVSEGVALYAGGEYEKAFEKYKAAAELGNIEGIYKIGYCYYYGKGVEQNFENAVYWYQKSAEQGYKQAQCALGDCYGLGKGVEQNYETAKYWWNKTEK